MRICKVTYCNKKHKAKGFCDRHYHQKNKYGKILRKSPYEINKQGKNAIAWKGDKAGYGALHDWLREKYPKPERCQKCDKKTKILDLSNNGKYTRNIEDYEYLCRSCHGKKDGAGSNARKGEQQWQSKLKEKDILLIRRLYKEKKFTQYELASMYSVKQSAIQKIISKKSWRHI